MDTYKPGDVILDKYEVTAVLGEGGMGCVFAARDLALDRLVALKFLLPALRGRPDCVSRFEREARTAARIQNEHVARIHGVERVADVPFMVMEYLRGRDLADVLRERGRLPVDEAIDLQLQACEAVAEAHTLGIVHRDLKPSNLFVAETSHGKPTVKVLDFGISKTVGTDEVALTAGAAMLGSPVYMSPEQCESARHVDARSDIWSLGVVFYELLTGTVPFKGETIPSVWRAISSGRYAKLSEHRDDIPSALEEALAAALAVHRAERLPSVEALAAKLAPFGTDGARASYGRIQDIVARAAALTKETPEPQKAVGRGVVTRDETKDTASVLVQSQASVSATPTPARPSRGWLAWSALGVVASAAALFGVLAPRSATAPVAAATNGSASASAAPTLSVEASQAACDEGDAAACNRLGARYARGDGVDPNATEAVTHYQRACDLKLALGCANLGAMLFDGDGVAKNEELAVHKLSEGCEGGAPQGCLGLSVAYATGRGAPNDPAEAVTYAERACTGRVPEGCVRAAVAKITGEGAPKDVKGGLAQLDAACKRGESVACNKLVALYEKGIGTDIPLDTVRSRLVASKGCDAGSDAACQEQRIFAKEDSTGVRSAQFNEWFRTSCDKGDLVACAMLGKNLVDGIGTKVDREKGIELLRRSCAGHVADACEKLSEMGVL